MYYEELGPLTVRQVGIVNGQTIPATTGLVTVPTVAPTRIRTGALGKVNAAAVTRKLNNAVKKDPLDTFIGKMEGYRPVCPVAQVEDAWVKLTNWFVTTTPEIPVLPA